MSKARKDYLTELLREATEVTNEQHKYSSPEQKFGIIAALVHAGATRDHANTTEPRRHVGGPL